MKSTTIIGLVAFLAVYLQGTLAQISSQCVCPAGPAAQTAVCGNDGKTYANVCDLNTAQSVNQNLGVRCLGSCPCQQSIVGFITSLLNICPRPFHNPYLGGFNFFANLFGHHSHSHGASNLRPHGEATNNGIDRAFHRTSNVKPTTVNPCPVNVATMDQVERAFRPSNGKPATSNPCLLDFDPSTMDQVERSIHRQKRAVVTTPTSTSVSNANKKFFVGGFTYNNNAGFGFAVFQQPTMCLTNGQEVSDLHAARCAISRDRTKTLGVRCLGFCNQCRGRPQCPVTQRPVTMSTLTPTSTTSTKAPTPGQTTPAEPELPETAPAVEAPPPLPDFLSAVHKIFE